MKTTSHTVRCLSNNIIGSLYDCISFGYMICSASLGSSTLPPAGQSQT